MSTELLTENFSPENFYQSQLSADLSASATEVFLDVVPVGTEGTLVIDPESPTNREIIYFNSKGTTKVICPANGRGYDNSTATSHTQGTAVIMAPIADWFNSMRSLFTTASEDWKAQGYTPTVSSGYNKGNKEYQLTYAADLSTVLSPGMRLKVDRTGTVPTQCLDLESSSSQYASKTTPTGITFTDDFTVEAWVKLESYANMVIVSRRPAGLASGWNLSLNASGQVVSDGLNGANYREWTSYQSIPLGQWVHVAATLDLSGTSGGIYINGVSVPISTATSGSPVAIVQAGDLQVGANAGANLFDGKLSDVRVWSTVRTATQIKDNMAISLTTSTGLVANFPLNGNLNDVSGNANNLTGSGGAVATATDNPYNATEYAIVTKISYSAPNTTVTVFTGTDYNIPNMTLANPYYSTQKAPYGFNAARGKWTIQSQVRTQISQAGPTSGTWYNIASQQLQVPTGDWALSYQTSPLVGGTSNATLDQSLSTANNTSGDTEFVTQAYFSGSTTIGSNRYRQRPVTLSAATTYYLNSMQQNGTGATIYNMDNALVVVPSIVEAECAYI